MTLLLLTLNQTMNEVYLTTFTAFATVCQARYPTSSSVPTELTLSLFVTLTLLTIIVLIIRPSRLIIQVSFLSSGLTVPFHTRIFPATRVVVNLQNNPDARLMIRECIREWNLWESWRAPHLPRPLEQCFNSYDRMAETNSAHLGAQQHYKQIHALLRVSVWLRLLALMNSLIQMIEDWFEWSIPIALRTGH